MLRPIGVRHYLEVMKSKGFSTLPVLKGSGLDEIQLARADILIDPMQCRAVIANMLTLTGSQGIGFDVGLSTTLSSLGAFGHATMTCNSMRDTHRIWGRFGSALVGISGRLDIVKEDSDSVTFEFACQDPHDPLLRFHFEELLSMIHAIGQPLVNETPVLKKLTLSFHAPSYEQRYYELFDCPIDFDAARTTVVIDRDWFEKQLQTNDEEFNKVCLKHCEEILCRIKRNQSVSALLHGLFMATSGPLPTLEHAASALGMSERTLSRRLQREGTNYRNIVDSFRANKACEYVRLGSVSQKEMAYMLGFSDSSALHHAFKTWTGQTIREYRNKWQQEAEAGLYRH